MDNGKGMFEEITEEKFKEQLQKEEPMVFKRGEVIEIRGSLFKVKKFSPTTLTLKLLPKK